MLTRNLLTVLLLAAAAVSSWWLYRQIQPGGASEHEAYTHEPDYFFEDFTVTAMDAQGQPKNRLQGTRMLHYPDDDTTELEDPELELYTDAVPTWQINAEHGWVSSGGDRVHLQGEVLIKRHGDQQQDAVYVRTREVTVRPDDEYAETDQLVVITSGNVKLQAVGMRAHIGTGRVELLSEVNGVHEPD